MYFKITYTLKQHFKNNLKSCQIYVLLLEDPSNIAQSGHTAQLSANALPICHNHGLHHLIFNHFLSAANVQITQSWSSLVVEMKAGSAQAESCCVYLKPEKCMHHMHGVIPQLFDCWADPVVHLLIVQSSTTQ